MLVQTSVLSCCSLIKKTIDPTCLQFPELAHARVSRVDVSSQVLRPLSPPRSPGAEASSPSSPAVCVGTSPSLPPSTTTPRCWWRRTEPCPRWAGRHTRRPARGRSLNAVSFFSDSGEAAAPARQVQRLGEGVRGHRPGRDVSSQLLQGENGDDRRARRLTSVSTLPVPPTAREQRRLHHSCGNRRDGPPGSVAATLELRPLCLLPDSPAVV